MNDQDRIERGIDFRKKMIESFERLAEAIKQEIAEYPKEGSQLNKFKLEIDVAEIEYVTLPAKKADLDAYMKHSTKK